MFDVLLSSILNVGIKSNIVVESGVGPLLYSREKKYGLFKYISILFLILGVSICSVATYFLEKFVLTKFDILDFKICIVVLIAGLFNLLVTLIWKKSTYFGRYLYASSCSYAFDLVYTVYIVMSLNMALEIAPFFMNLVAIAVVLFVMNALIGVFVESINRSSLDINFRNVSARLFLFAIIAFILHYANFIIA